MKFVAVDSELVLLDLIHIPPSGDSFLSDGSLVNLFWWRKADDEMDIKNSPYNFSPPRFFVPVLGLVTGYHRY